MAELKPCPFCGGEAEITEFDPFNGYQGSMNMYSVHCKKCGAEIVRNQNKDYAVDAWNRRADNATY